MIRLSEPSYFYKLITTNCSTPLSGGKPADIKAQGSSICLSTDPVRFRKFPCFWGTPPNELLWPAITPVLARRRCCQLMKSLKWTSSTSQVPYLDSRCPADLGSIWKRDQESGCLRPEDILRCFELLEYGPIRRDQCAPSCRHDRSN